MHLNYLSRLRFLADVAGGGAYTRDGFADGLRRQLSQHGLQRVEPLRKGETIFVDRLLHEPQQPDVLFIGLVKVHDPERGIINQWLQ